MDDNHQIKVSIVTATYNSDCTIADALRSVLNQSYQNIECLVIDGKSTDNTEAIIASLKIEYPDSEIRWISEKDAGIYDALNKGITLATGKIIGFVHSDDMLASNSIIETIVDTIHSENCDGVYGDLKYIQFDKPENVVRFWRSRPFTAHLLKGGWMPPHPTVFLKASVYNSIGLFDTSFKIAADYDLLLRLFTSPKLKVSYIPTTVTLMRLGGASNKSFRNIINKMKEDYKAITRHGIGGINTLILKNTSKLSQFWKH